MNRLIPVLFLLGAGLAHAEPLKILCIGDSITQGNGYNFKEEFTYRLPLQQKLTEAGIDYDFIGSQTKGLHPGKTWPDVAPGKPFDPGHEGYYGKKTAFVVGKVKEVLPTLPAPDVVLIDLGTNDQESKDLTADIVTPLEDLVKELRTKNPSVKIFLGQLALNYNSSGKRPVDISARLAELATHLNTADSPVVAVKHGKGWLENPGDPATDTYDWVHPNPQGQEKMATKWFNAMVATGVQ